MSRTLFIQPHLNGASNELLAISWLDSESDNQNLGDLDALREFCANIEYDKIVLIYPGELATFRLVETPTQNLKQARQAIPFLLEENLAADVDELHFAFGEKLKGKFPVLVADKVALINWVNQFEQADLLPHEALVDYSLIPTGNGLVTILIDAERALVTSSDTTAAVSLQVLKLYLQQLLENHGDLNTVELHYNDDLNDIDVLTDIELLCEEKELVCTSHKLEESVLAYFASNYASRASEPGVVNLLQSGIKSASASGAGSFNWKPFAWVAGLWIGVQMLFDASQLIYFKNVQSQLNDQVEATYRELLPSDKNFFHYPKEKRLIYMEKFFAQNVNDEQSADFLALLSATSKQLKAMSASEAINIHSLTYNERRQRLELDVFTSAVKSMESFEKSMSGAGYNVEIGAARKDKENYKAKLQVYL